MYSYSYLVCPRGERGSTKCKYVKLWDYDWNRSTDKPWHNGSVRFEPKQEPHTRTHPSFYKQLILDPFLGEKKQQKYISRS